VTQHKLTLYFYDDKKKNYIHSSLNVVLCLSILVHNRVENIIKHVFFYVHDIKVMVEEIGLSIRKLPRFTQLRVNPKLGKFCLQD